MSTETEPTAAQLFDEVCALADSLGLSVIGREERAGDPLKSRHPISRFQATIGRNGRPFARVVIHTLPASLTDG